MDAEQFTKTVLARVSTDYNPTAANQTQLIAALNQVRQGGQRIDVAKKAMFYTGEPISPPDYTPVSKRHLIHAVLGMASEVAELIECFMTWWDMGEALDEVNLHEELGDLLWYIALAAHVTGTSIPQLMSQNDAKLSARYGPAFSSDAAVNRDLDAERKALKGE